MRADKYGYFHDSAAGDFLLMSRKIVHAIRGYPEIPTNIMIDGTAIHAAAAHGFGQLLFADDCVIYHQVLQVFGCGSLEQGWRGGVGSVAPVGFNLYSSHSVCQFVSRSVYLSVNLPASSLFRPPARSLSPPQLPPLATSPGSQTSNPELHIISARVSRLLTTHPLYVWHSRIPAPTTRRAQ